MAAGRVSDTNGERGDGRGGTRSLPMNDNPATPVQTPEPPAASDATEAPAPAPQSGTDDIGSMMWIYHGGI